MTSEECNNICNKHRASYDLPPRPTGNYDCLESCQLQYDCPLMLEALDFKISYN